ncbi:MAG: hypothetical protein AB1589_41600 [Cyanobacteriota bacterium]
MKILRSDSFLVDGHSHKKQLTLITTLILPQRRNLNPRPTPETQRPTTSADAAHTLSSGEA